MPKHHVKLKLKKMKKKLLIFIAALAIICGDGSNRSSENKDNQTEDYYSDDAVESDTTDMKTDTTSTPGMDRRGDVDTVSHSNR
jgi:hypothetical protein